MDTIKIHELNPSNKILRRMDYFNDQEGIMNRYLNESENWDKHLKNTQNFIINSLGGQTGGIIAILGSGWLLDVPIDFLAANFDQVHLYDIRHPSQICHKYKHFKNIVFNTLDISGGAISGVYELIKKNKNLTPSHLEALPINGFYTKYLYDFVASVNILGQLDILVVEYLRKTTRIKEPDLIDFRRKIQTAHLKSLPQGKSAVIADYKELVYNRLEEEQSSSTHLFIDLPSGAGTEEWIWDFDTKMTYYPNRFTKLMVRAFKL